MSTSVRALVNQPYKYGFVTDIPSESIGKGLNEEVIRQIWAKKGEPDFMLEFRLRAYRQWLKMSEPTWPNVSYPPIDYQNIVYYSAPKPAPPVPFPEDSCPDRGSRLLSPGSRGGQPRSWKKCFFQNHWGP